MVKAVDEFAAEHGLKLNVTFNKWALFKPLDSSLTNGG